MVFSSIIFLLFFLPLFLLGYEIIGKRFKNHFILLSSIAFYTWGAPEFVFILMASTILDFYLVKNIHKTTNKGRKRLFLGVSLSMNLGLLAYFKYANFFVENFNLVLNGMGFESFGWTSVVLPIGISFYTFQTLTYAIDVYRNMHAPLKKMSDYLLYIMSFPQMIAGPIVKYNSIADQIIERKETIDDKLQGVIRFCVGLGKKVLIANVMGQQADLIMNSPLDDISMGYAWLGIIAYSFQIYFDFSGYSDMAIGLGKIMGFSFPENFNNPYNSKSITEFWKRWHITLGQWMKDYLYIPLGGNKVSSNARLFFNLGTVFLISGLWHGASWNFVIWGGFHGFFLILDRLFLKKTLKKIGGFFSVIFTYTVVLIGWVFFKLEEFSEATAYIGKMFSFDFINKSSEIISSFNFTIVLAIIFSFIGLFKFGRKWEQKLYYNTTPTLTWSVSWMSIAILILIVSISSLAAEGFNPFIYFRF